MSLVIRDAIPADVSACLDLNHDYETEHVWQMRLQQTVSGSQVTFRKERLPRRLTVTYPADKRRLELALAPETCFLIAQDRETQDIHGYLTMWINPVYYHATIHDLVVSRPFRRAKVGSSLLRIARMWAQEQYTKRLYIETQTKNFPAIQFCQAKGFTFCGFNDHYFPDQDIAVFFSQTLR